MNSESTKSIAALAVGLILAAVLLLAGCATTSLAYKDTPRLRKAKRAAEEYSNHMLPEYRDHAYTDYLNGYMHHKEKKP